MFINLVTQICWLYFSFQSPCQIEAIFLCVFVSAEAYYAPWPRTVHHADQVQPWRWLDILLCKRFTAERVVFPEWRTSGHIWRTQWCRLVHWCWLYPWLHLQMIDLALDLIVSSNFLAVDINYNSCLSCCCCFLVGFFKWKGKGCCLK